MSLFNSRDKRPRDKRVMLFYEWEPLMVSHHPARFGGHMYCGSGDSVFSGEGHDFLCLCLNPPLLFISKAHGMPCLYTQKKFGKLTQ